MATNLIVSLRQQALSYLREVEIVAEVSPFLAQQLLARARRLHNRADRLEKHQAGSRVKAEV